MAYAHRGGDFGKRLQLRLAGYLEVVWHLCWVYHPENSSDFAATRGLRSSHAAELLAPPRLGLGYLVERVDVKPLDVAFGIYERGDKAFYQVVGAVAPWQEEPH